MAINFSTAITDLAGNPLVDNGGHVTLAALCINALLMPLPDGRTGQPETVSALEKVRYGALAQRIHDAAGALDLKAEDVSLLKDRVGRAYAPLAVMRAWALLDPTEAP